MTELKRYPEYKDSGVEWLSEIPSAWSVCAFGRFARFRNGADYSSVEVADGGYPVYGSAGEFRRASEFLFDGESVLFGRKGTVDRPLHVTGRFWTVDTMYYTEIATRHLVPRFVYYWATQLPYSYWLTSTALPSMTQSDLSAAKIPYISIEDQDAIVAFLDRETAEIDAFIADQEELIGLLAERRAAAVDVLLRQDDGKGIRNMIKLGWAFDFLNGDRGSDYPDRRDLVESGVPVTCSTACVDQLVRTQSFVGPVEVRWHHRWWRYGLGRERSIAATRSGYSIRGWNDTRGCC